MNQSYDRDTEATTVAKDLSSHIQGKVVLTTGVSPGGLGAIFVSTIAAHKPKLLILAGRDLKKVQETANDIKKDHPDVEVRPLELDLTSQAQIRKAAAEVNEYAEPIDILMNNAGIMAVPYSTTKEGIEIQFGVNHIGHFLFTNLIMGKLLAAGPGARVVNVSSDGHRLGDIRFDDLSFQDGKNYDTWRAYGQAKTANVLFSIALAEKLGSKGLLSFSLHPGAIWTNLGTHLSGFEELNALDRELGNKQGGWKEFPFKTIQQGTSTHIVAAFDPVLSEHNGAYLHDCKLAPEDEMKPHAFDKPKSLRLWSLSEELVGQKFDY